MNVYKVEQLENKPEISEKELAQLCARGDSSARKELYNRYATRLCALCSRYTNGAEEGIDLMHDTMIKAFQKIRHYRYGGTGSLYAWLSRMAINMAIDRIRKQGKLSIIALDENTPDVEEPTPEEIRSIPLPVLQRMIASLPDSKRLVFNMFCIDWLSHREIAKQLGITEKTSSSTLSKAKKMLSTIIKNHTKRDGRMD